MENVVKSLPMPPLLPSDQISFWSSGDSCENIYIKDRDVVKYCRITGVMRIL